MVLRFLRGVFLVAAVVVVAVAVVAVGWGDDRPLVSGVTSAELRSERGE